MNSKPIPKVLELDTMGFAYTPGIDYETQDITVVARNAETIVLKVGGHTAWSGQHQPRAYIPASYMVFRIKSVTPMTEGNRAGYHRLDVVPLIEWDAQAGRKKRDDR